MQQFIQTDIHPEPSIAIEEVFFSFFLFWLTDRVSAEASWVLIRGSQHDKATGDNKGGHNRSWHASFFIFIFLKGVCLYRMHVRENKKQMGTEMLLYYIACCVEDDCESMLYFLRYLLCPAGDSSECVCDGDRGQQVTYGGYHRKPDPQLLHHRYNMQLLLHCTY